MPSDKPQLLIVDDDEDLRNQMKWAFIEDFDVLLAEDRPSALQILNRAHPVIVTLDLGLPPSPNQVNEGMDCLAEIVERHPKVKVIVITGQDGREHALKAVAQGAYDFLAKPIHLDDLKVILQRAIQLTKLEDELRRLQRDRDQDAFEGMLLISPQMQEVFESIRKVAPSDAPVLILGDSGTGKEMAARAIHQLSPRRKGPFVAINCGAIPENLLESELFGHEKGAFTGAHAQKLGRIEGARNGILFLDEIGELPPLLQVKLLRFLQEGQIQRVGGNKDITVDVRVIAATNADLEKLMAEAGFRDDLYYRLAVVVISMPSLQDREGEIPVLARAFLDRHASESRKKITGFAPKAIAALENYSWPGNVRELENRVRRGVIMAEGSQITAADLGFSSDYEKYQGLSLREAREALEKELVERALSRNQGNVSRAAAELEISRPTLYELIDKLEIKR